MRVYPPAPRVRLDPESVLDAAAIGPVGEGIYVLDPAALLASAGQESVRTLRLAPDDHHVAAGSGEAATVLVAPRLERDVVVAGPERAAPDDHAIAGFGNAAVAVRAGCRGGDALDRHVRAERRMDLPERWAGDPHAPEENAPAPRHLDRRGPQAIDHDAFVGRSSASDERFELSCAVRAPVPGGGRSGVERAASGESDVRLTGGVDHRRAIDAFEAFVPGPHRWIPLPVAGEPRRRALGEVKLHPAAQAQRAGEEHAGRHDHAAASRGMAGVDRILDGPGLIGRPLANGEGGGGNPRQRGRREDRVPLWPRSGARRLRQLRGPPEAAGHHRSARSEERRGRKRRRFTVRMLP